MKLFDFSDGRKGNEIGSFHWGHSGTWHVAREDGSKVSVSSNRYSFANDFGNNNKNFTMDNLEENFGVKAVCFCEGQNNYTGEWLWRFSATREWLNENHKSLQLKIVTD